MTKDEWIYDYILNVREISDCLSLEHHLGKAWDAGFREAMAYRTETYDPVNYPSVAYHG